MIAIDTNILVYAHRPESEFYQAAYELMAELADGPKPWAIPWPCVYEFLRVVTHPQVFRGPSPLEAAIEAVEVLLDSPSVILLGEGPRHRNHLRRVALAGPFPGSLIHDAHIAALAFEHGVTEFLSADRDFTRLPGLRVRNPFARAK